MNRPGLVEALVCPGFGGVSSLDSEVRRVGAADGFRIQLGVHSDARLASLTVVEDFEVVEDRCGQLDPGFHRSYSVTRLASGLQNDSIITLMLL